MVWDLSMTFLWFGLASWHAMGRPHSVSAIFKWWQEVSHPLIHNPSSRIERAPSRIALLESSRLLFFFFHRSASNPRYSLSVFTSSLSDYTVLRRTGKDPVFLQHRLLSLPQLYFLFGSRPFIAVCSSSLFTARAPACLSFCMSQFVLLTDVYDSEPQCFFAPFAHKYLVTLKQHFLPLVFCF